MIIKVYLVSLFNVITMISYVHFMIFCLRFYNYLLKIMLTMKKYFVTLKD